MNTAATLSSSDSAPPPPPRLFDCNAWVGYLRNHIGDVRWRPEEFDDTRWLFTGDPDNPLTTTTRCLVQRCDTLVGSRSLCASCAREFKKKGGGQEEFVARYRPLLTGTRESSDGRCAVEAGGVRCQRRRHTNQTGLCQAHTSQWNKRGRRGIPRGRWRTEVARPLPARPACAVAGCPADRTASVALCGPHRADWRREQHGRIDSQCESAELWAGVRTIQPRPHQFSLAVVAPTVRWELLYALRRRDSQGQKIHPHAMRVLLHALAGVDSIATTPFAHLRARIGKTASAIAYLRILTQIIELAYEDFIGIRHTDKDTWNSLALDLQSPRTGRRLSSFSIDFTPISQQWLRDVTKEYIRTFRPDSGKIGRVLLAGTIASRGLSRRPGGGHIMADLRYADMAAVHQEFKNSLRIDGQPYTNHFRRDIWAKFHAVLELGRAAGPLDELPGAFGRHISQTMPHDDTNEDQIGRAIPETVIAQLDSHLHLMGADRTYGRAWSQTSTTALFRAAYLLLRDTGRRPGEIVSLATQCLEIDDGQHCLVYDNHKKNRLRRRLPITTDTADTIREWQHHRATLQLPASTQPWLFPSWGETAGPGYLSTNRLVRAFKAWAAAIPVLHGEVPGPEGTPVPFDRSLIVPYGFRHSYAQRHADAGVNVEILKELMDHTSMEITQGYYKISLNRKREAISIMSRYVHDRAGNPTTGTTSATTYELRSVAVPFGNCIEPSNVKAGGAGCPIRFQCAGCGFYRPDPSYLPAIEEHINALRADRETALAIGVGDFVTRNLTDQATAFRRVADTMRERINELPEHERAELEHASTVLRKLRAGQDSTPSRPLLPLTVVSAQ